jgi:hypothetical protein
VVLKIYEKTGNVILEEEDSDVGIKSEHVQERRVLSLRGKKRPCRIIGPAFFNTGGK